MKLLIVSVAFILLSIFGTIALLQLGVEVFIIAGIWAVLYILFRQWLKRR